MRIIRVFPRKTSATPDDDLVRIGGTPTLFDEADEVHISVLFTYDLPAAERLAREWGYVAPVKIGGPATGDTGGAFVPGRYVKHGFMIHSRGCPNTCWFCVERNTELRLLTVCDGWNDLSSNLLACPDEHIKAVFAAMAKSKKLYGRAPEFTGGLEAKRLQPWHVEALRAIKPKQLFFANDTPDDLEPLRVAGRLLIDGGFTTASHALRAYVLCGWPKDTIEAAAVRMQQTIDAGFLPMAMLYRDNSGRRDPVWQKWGRQWARPSIAASKAEKL